MAKHPIVADAILKWFIKVDENRPLWLGEVGSDEPPKPSRTSFFDTDISWGVKNLYPEIPDRLFINSFDRELDYLVAEGYVDKMPALNTFKYSLSYEGADLTKRSSIAKKRMRERLKEWPQRNWVIVSVCSAILGSLLTILVDLVRDRMHTKNQEPQTIQIPVSDSIQMKKSIGQFDSSGH